MEATHVSTIGCFGWLDGVNYLQSIHCVLTVN